IIKALDEREFITRNKVKDDGRRALLAISPAGVALIEELAPERTAIHDAIEKRYGAEQHERLLDMLESLIESESAPD
ncbi:MAG: homoprotocatechuate degradation operon regulator HpaR, partial [Mesorhizobium sp.]